MHTKDSYFAKRFLFCEKVLILQKGAYFTIRCLFCGKALILQLEPKENIASRNSKNWTNPKTELYWHQLESIFMAKRKPTQKYVSESRIKRLFDIQILINKRMTPTKVYSRIKCEKMVSVHVKKCVKWWCKK